METKLKIGLILIIVILVLSGGLIFLNEHGLITKSDDLKYCESDDDCITSCGREIGRGSCYNKAFVEPNNPPDNTCCRCEDCRPCITCKCIYNTCMPEKTGGTCC